jgi:DHHC palmitoyltransferase
VLQTVGLLNYKAFLLFLFYTMLAATLATGLLLRSFISFFVQGDEEDLARWAALRRSKLAMACQPA